MANFIAREYKSRKYSAPKFYQDIVKIQFTDTHVKAEGFSSSRKKNKQKLNWIRLAEHERIPTENCRYMNPRIKHDGLNWWIAVGFECEESSATLPADEGIGIDLGVKDLAICSDKNIYKNINKTNKTIKEKEAQATAFHIEKI